MQSFRKIYLKILITSLSISALIGILTILLSPDSAVWRKVVLIAISAVGYSITGTCCSLLLEKRSFKHFSYTGIVISVAGFLLTLWGILKGADSIEDIALFKTILFSVLFSTSWFHNSLMLLIKPIHKFVSIARITGVSINGLLTLLFSLRLLAVFKPNSKMYIQFLGISFILLAVTTILAPVLQLAYKNKY
ncbi:MAG: hypothetical protein KAR07_02995 [Spirochaetes bacterium]|nr:hypothetical protein [Spirochaetota bacterium]